MTTEPPTGETSPASPHVRVDCYVRTASITEPIESRLDALRELTRTGSVDQLEVHLWPERIVLSPTTDDHPAVECHRTFVRWAAQWGASVEPPFARETQTSRYTDETREVLHTPALCLSVSVNGHLEEVFPHTADGVTYGIDDGIAALSDREGVLAGASGSAAGFVDPATGRCVGCDRAPVTGQGLYACPACDWVAVPGTDGRLERFEVPGDRAKPQDAAGDVAEAEDEDVERHRPLP